MCSWTKGARISIPQKPRITLGIAASISTSGEITLLTPFGASRLRKSPIEIAIGAPRKSAKNEVTIVPKSSVPAPNSSKGGFGCQVVWKTKPSPNLEIEGPAPWTTS